MEGPHYQQRRAPANESRDSRRGSTHLESTTSVNLSKSVTNQSAPPLPAQVKHLVSVETAQQRTERLAALEKKLAWRPPIEVKH